MNRMKTGRLDCRFLGLAALAFLAVSPEPAAGLEEEGKTSEWIELGWDAWQPDRGDWVSVENAFLNPSDPGKLAFEPGEGVLVNGKDGKTVDLHSVRDHGDVEAHIEFMVSKGSNSGVYFQSRYEIQVFDSWGAENPMFSDCGGIYQRWRDGEGFEGRAPNVNASRPPGEWQSFDIVFRAPRFDGQGKKLSNARFETVRHNGVLVHENIEVGGPTRASTFEDEVPSGPLMLQGDHGPVAYRNIRMHPLRDDR